MLDLFIGWDWTTFFADYGKPGSKYLRVNPSNAIILLEKYVMNFTIDSAPSWQLNNCLSSYIVYVICAAITNLHKM